MTVAEQLRARRRTVAASRARRTPRAVPPALPPNGIVTSYASALLSVSRELDEAFAAELTRAGIPLRTDAQGDVPDLPDANALRRRLEAIAGRILSRRDVLATIQAIGARTNTWSRDQWAKQVKASLGVDLTGDIDLQKKLAKFRDENVALIKSLADDKVARVHKVLTEAGVSTRVEVIAKRITAETGATASRAALIARDQVLSLNAQVTQARHVAAGVTEYVWRASRDERVREGHRALDGTRQKYSEPPIVDEKSGRRENPGQDFQCRCTAEPWIEGFDT